MNNNNKITGIEVTLERDPRDRTRPTRKFDRWLAWHGDDLLVEGARDPEHDACRELLARGVTGTVVFRHKGALRPSMTMDIEKAARLTVKENANHGPRLVPYKDPSLLRGLAVERDQDPDRPTGTADAQTRSGEPK